MLRISAVARDLRSVCRSPLCPRVTHERKGVQTLEVSPGSREGIRRHLHLRGSCNGPNQTACFIVASPGARGAVRTRPKRAPSLAALICQRSRLVSTNKASRFGASIRSQADRAASSGLNLFVADSGRSASLDQRHMVHQPTGPVMPHHVMSSSTVSTVRPASRGFSRAR